MLQAFPRMASLKQGILIASFLASIGRQGPEQKQFNSQTEGQDFLRQTIMYDYNDKSNEK